MLLYFTLHTSLVIRAQNHKKISLFCICGLIKALVRWAIFTSNIAVKFQSHYFYWLRCLKNKKKRVHFLAAPEIAVVQNNAKGNFGLYSLRPNLPDIYFCLFNPFCIQSNSVITNSQGPAKFVRYNRETL